MLPLFLSLYRVIHEAGPGLRSEWQCSLGSFGDVVESPVTTLAALQLYCGDEDEGSFYIHKKKKVILGYQRENCWMAPYFLSFGVFPNAAIDREKWQTATAVPGYVPQPGSNAGCSAPGWVWEVTHYPCMRKAAPHLAWPGNHKAVIYRLRQGCWHLR